jgi:hypothetical protein
MILIFTYSKANKVKYKNIIDSVNARNSANWTTCYFRKMVDIFIYTKISRYPFQLDKDEVKEKQYKVKEFYSKLYTCTVYQVFI